MARNSGLDPAGLARARERLAALIPGYAAYGGGRWIEDDRVVREAVARQLGVVIGRFGRAIETKAQDLPAIDLDEIGAVISALKRFRDRVHFSPAGSESLLGRGDVTERELEILVTLDAALWATLSEIENQAGELDRPRGSSELWSGDTLREAIFELQEAIADRESFLGAEQ